MIALNVRDRGFGDFAGPLWLDQAAPLGWLALERLAMLAFGAGERAMRLLPVAFGLGRLAVCVWIGRRWMTPIGAALLIVLVSLGDWLVFFTLELKHYSADTFWALLLPALVAWALEAPNDPRALTRRIGLWWSAAAIGIWFGHGAMFVAPACVVVLITGCLRQRGVRFAAWAGAIGVIWVGSFALHYTFGLRYLLANAYLQNFWAFAFPPADAGFAENVRWFGRLLEPFAVKPGGTEKWAAFWLASISGFAFAIATRPALGLAFAAVPLSAIILAVLHIVPPAERLALWVVPALYVGIALCGDAAISLLGRPWRWRIVQWTGAGVLGAIAMLVGVDVARRGAAAIEARPLSNYRLDDRNSVRVMLALHRPGDALISTHFGLAGLWWYTRVNLAHPDQGSRLADGTPVFEIGHVAPGEGCRQSTERVAVAFKDLARVIVYLGFRTNVEPPGFDNLVLEELSRRGAMVAYREDSEDGIVAAFDLTVPPLQLPLVRPGPITDSRKIPVPAGCLAVRPARRW